MMNTSENSQYYVTPEGYVGAPMTEIIKDAVELDLNLDMVNFPEDMNKEEDMSILNTTLDGIVNMLSALDNKLNQMNTKMNNVDDKVNKLNNKVSALENKMEKLKCHNSSGFCYISGLLSPIIKSFTGKETKMREEGGNIDQKKEGTQGGSGESKKQMEPCYVSIKDIERKPRETKRKIPHTSEKAQKKQKILHKVWTIKRTRKKFFYADTLKELLAKATTEFGCQGHIRLVLEEDGTQVETDETLRACAGRVMLVLGGDETWHPETKLYDNEAYRLTFDVCSFDRKDRKLVLADSIKDLKYQGSSSFGYPVTSVCLEEDGTVIDNDRTLCSCSTKTLMLLGAEHAWKGSPSALVTLPSSYTDMSVTDPNTESCSDESQVGMYKVWTEDRQIKKVVFAENIIDLHLKASKALGLRTPVVVTLENNQTFEITDDDILKENTGKILIVREKITETGFNQVNDPLYDDPVGQNKYSSQQSWTGHQLNSVNYNHGAISNQMYVARNSVHENSGSQQISRGFVNHFQNPRFSSSSSFHA